MAAAHLVKQRVGLETPTQRQRHRVLRQHVQAATRRGPRLDFTACDGLARGGVLNQFQRLRGHAQRMAGFARTMLGPPRPLQQPRHALGAAHLQHLVHRRKVHAQVQAGGSHHATNTAVAQALFGAGAQRRVQRTVVQRQRGQVFRPDRLQRAVPKLGLRAGVGEQQAGAHVEQPLVHARQLRQAQMPGPGQRAVALGQQGRQRHLARPRARHQCALRPMRQQHIAGFVQIAQGGRQAPGSQGGRQAS
ncbi:hypothetical protein D3C86_506140 [compost metagenome]